MKKDRTFFEEMMKVKSELSSPYLDVFADLGLIDSGTGELTELGDYILSRLECFDSDAV